MNVTITTKNLRAVTVVAVLMICAGFNPPPACAACAMVEEDQQIRMGERDCAELRDSGYRLTVRKFANHPCPPGARCLWSGVGIVFEHQYYSQSMEGIDLIEAFGFDVTVHETDHETFALISIQRLDED